MLTPIDAPEIARPHAGGDHHLVGTDGAVSSLDADRRAILRQDADDLGILEDLRRRSCGRRPPSACVTSIGLTWPSLGRKTPPTAPGRL